MKLVVSLLCMVALVFSMTLMAQEKSCCEKCDKSKCAECKECKDGKMCNECAKLAYTKMMQTVVKFGEPGEWHKMLDKSIGSWKTNLKMFDFNGNVVENNEGTSQRTWVLDGRFVQEEVKGVGNYAGVSLLGYDNMRKVFQFVWVDNMSTSMAVSEGTADADGKVITLLSPEYTCPVTGKNLQWKNVNHIQDNDHYVVEMICIDKKAGVEWKMMEIAYTRVVNN